ncbi:MAG: PQQ-dependent sugar dehydrogenase, partial [Acidimicrobiia bacterium]
FRPGTDQLFVGTGDAAQGTKPQSRTSLGGKVLRIKRDGSAYPGNEAITTGFDDRIYNHGHRNVQGIAFHPVTNKPYGMEHGPGRDDELNKLKNGRNYGWDPVPGYNESTPMTDFAKFPKAITAVWNSGASTIAPSGITFLDGPQWENWDDEVAAAVLKNTELRIFFLKNNGNKLKKEQGLGTIDGGDARLRSAVQGPDGNLYLVTDGGGSAGQIWRVTPS